jgi:hypothetical protein
VTFTFCSFKNVLVLYSLKGCHLVIKAFNMKINIGYVFKFLTLLYILKGICDGIVIFHHKVTCFWYIISCVIIKGMSFYIDIGANNNYDVMWYG